MKSNSAHLELILFIRFYFTLATYWDFYTFLILFVRYLHPITLCGNYFWNLWCLLYLKSIYDACLLYTFRFNSILLHFSIISIPKIHHFGLKLKSDPMSWNLAFGYSSIFRNHTELKANEHDLALLNITALLWAFEKETIQFPL